jgi:integrase
MMSRNNPMWGAPRIQGELLKLGIEITEPTVSKYMVRHRKPPSQTWRTFLQNHVHSLVSVDFFTVPTIQFGVLYVFLALAHDRRRILHFGVAAGLRPGEIMGLKVMDVSETVLTIRRRIYRRISDTTKSKRGGRVVPLTDPGTRNMLREYLSILPDSSADAWLFSK